MSYILDALKRAEAERGRGAVPGLHVSQVSTALADARPSARSQRWLLAAAMAVVVSGGIAAGLWVWRAPVRDPAPAPAPVPAVAILPQPVAPTPRVVASSPSAPARPPVAKASPDQLVAAAVPLLGDLPQELRRLIPPLSITGVVYSENPGQRLLLVNNLVLPQGSLAAPEVNLDEIQPKSSVFSFRGTRFRVGH
ncbi:general secretion pathway protein GspB [Rhodoferax sp.]|uniref:general secretion pathway protein GspB n=1 Tax=Rhodoferax sp. TaxID=50421 RepID=UPI00276F6541|nr:general secretion pathway protein GspB [Rhodoferax sp.]